MRSLLALRYDEGGTIMMIQNAIEVAPVYPLIVEAIRSTNARRIINVSVNAKNELKDFPFAYTNFHGPSTFRITVLTCALFRRFQSFPIDSRFDSHILHSNKLTPNVVLLREKYLINPMRSRASPPSSFLSKKWSSSVTSCRRRN